MDEILKFAKAVVVESAGNEIRRNQSSILGSNSLHQYSNYFGRPQIKSAFSDTSTLLRRYI